MPVPADVSATFRSLAEAFERMRQDRGAGPDTETDDDDLLSSLVHNLLASADDPPKELEGVSDEYLDALERVPRKQLKEGDVCPICGQGFLEDEYPLVVRLPCDERHWFDLECVRPWLKVRGTCPLDRVDLGKREQERRQKGRGRRQGDEEVEGEGEDWDGMYA